jgi:hypothetical protein
VGCVAHAHTGCSTFTIAVFAVTGDAASSCYVAIINL